MVGLWYYNQSGVTDLLIMRDLHYGRMCFKSVKSLRALHLSCGKGPRLRMQSSSGVILYVTM